MSIVVTPDTVAGSGLRIEWLATRGGRCHEVKWETALYESVFRKLGNESLSVILSLAKLGDEERVVGVDQLVKVSRLYRNTMT